MTKLRVDDEHYEFSHGHKPRGNGNWLVQVDGTEVFEYRGTITQLKRDITKMCTDNGLEKPRRIKILP